MRRVWAWAGSRAFLSAEGAEEDDARVYLPRRLRNRRDLGAKSIFSHDGVLLTHCETPW